MATIIISVLICLAVVFAIKKITKDKAKGKCTGCSYSGCCNKSSCHKN